ncbi:alpha/beta fold hydrolase [Dactylosporangium sp. CA-152071]|uniref:alpha/beta fold hydrolase n=1 Tax=Dactylosporangium sp. CA-152071 TaxID=3239933 RepID=UPI003D8E9FCC
MRLLPEPVAAAAYYVDVLGEEFASGRCLLVYDLGAGTFDVAVVRRTDDGFAVVSADGLGDVGGLDIDAAVVEHARRAGGGGADWGRLDWPQTADDLRARHLLWQDARAAKEQLTRRPGAEVRVPLVEAAAHLSREEFEALARPLLERTVAWTVRVLREARVPREQVAGLFLAREFAAGCGDPADLPFASTRNTARDMDRVRVALGERKVSYLGYSYGTYLGAVYLQMFGEHADRVVLDSAVDPGVYGPGLLSRNAPAIQAALERWAGWGAGRDAEYGLGSTAQRVLARVARIGRAPSLRIGVYTVDEHVVPCLLFVSLYDDSAETYAALAENLAVFDRAARTGEAVPPTEGLAAFLDGLYTGAGNACVDGTVERYLLDGVLPQHDSEC